MASNLRKLPGRPPERGMYAISGSLDGVVPGRRVIRELEVTGLDGSAGAEGLAPLLAFCDLRRLTLQRVRNVDLEVLNRLPLELLQFEQAAGLDLRSLTWPDGLQHLALIDLDDDCVIPDELVLPPTLGALAVMETRQNGSGRQVQAVLEAVDWARLAGLIGLYATVGGYYSLPPIEIDLSFLRGLPELKYLDLGHVYHAGPGPSPMEPPFEGLSRNLERIMTEAWDPDAIQAGLQRHLGLPVDPTLGPAGIAQRHPYTPPPPPFEIHPPLHDDGTWSAYGSLADAADLPPDHTETDALRDARARLRQADRALLTRLDFDGESSGTAIMATSREDLQAALRILGLGEH